ncbi:MAG: hypothetical protein E6J11_04510 [Chloroflexi bacterium]|nr:MAG: hypothetical protein E6J11_04510 [Chloroflexota bacterium]
MASWWQKTLAMAAGVAGLAAGAYYYFVQRPLPKKKGDLIIEGLHEPVEIIFDRFGVPHISTNWRGSSSEQCSVMTRQSFTITLVKEPPYFP